MTRSSSYDEAGKAILSLPGKDTVSIIDISDRAKPRIVANLPIENSIVGPPTNLAITPDGRLALVANSIDVVKDGDNLKNVPDNKLYVIDLTASPPAVVATLQLGKQPSGMAINREGSLALVANRADNTVSVLSIAGKTVTVVDTVALAPANAPSQQLSAVAITPDGKRALVAEGGDEQVALLDINGCQGGLQGLRHDHRRLPLQCADHSGRQARPRQQQRGIRGSRWPGGHGRGY